MAWKDKLFHPQNIVDDAYEIGIILKAAGGVVECIAGIGLLFISSLQIQHLVAYITRAELLEDPHDLIARHLSDWSMHLGHNATLFGAVYLLSHGIVKVGIVVALLLKKNWAYPAAIVVFSGFAIYQIYATYEKTSIGYALLTVYDLIIIYLVWLEYKKVREEPDYS